MEPTLGIFFPYVVFAGVQYKDTYQRHIDFDQADEEFFISSLLVYNISEHLSPFLIKKKCFAYEKELRIFTRWQTLTLNGPTFLSDSAIFNTDTGETITRKCTSRYDIELIMKEVISKGKPSRDIIENMQPIGFFHKIPLENIINRIYIQKNVEKNIKTLLIGSKHEYLLNKLTIL